MQTILAAIAVFAIVMLAMAVGVIFSNRRLRGSCGGTGRDCTCDDTTRKDCELKKAAEAAGEAG
ncbi:MAG: hypothetical protein OEV20_07525 [Actinomycetota bacterium]|nr:hypothetical protein [Actinomycetota bacterium]